MNENDIARFWNTVDRREESECWPWKNAGMVRGGYGKFKLNGKHLRAHRVAFTLAGGSIPPGFYVCHRCDNPICCNPAHLFAGSPSDNAQDREDKGRGSLAGVSKINAMRKAGMMPLPNGKFARPTRSDHSP